MDVSTAIKKRQSISKFDPEAKISDDELRQLFELAKWSPTSFNMQNIRYVVIRDPERRKKLRAMSFDQEQVETSSAVIVICGVLDAYKNAELVWSQAPKEVQEMIVPKIGQFYGGNPALQREEAVRSGSIASSILMLAAVEMGFATGPMIGFDPKAVSEFIGLDENHFPVMMLVIGKDSGIPKPRGHRYEVSDLVTMDKLNGPSL
jgi:nitroreductase